MKSKTGPSHVEDRGPSRAASLGMAYASAMFDAQWSQLLNLLKFPSQCPEFARNRKTLHSPSSSSGHCSISCPPCSYLYSHHFRHTTARLLHSFPVYPPETHMLVLWRRKTSVYLPLHDGSTTTSMKSAWTTLCSPSPFLTRQAPFHLNFYHIAFS